MSTESARLAEHAGPYLSAAVQEFGERALAESDETTRNATADLGRRIIRSALRHCTRSEKSALEDSVRDAAVHADDPDAIAALRYQIKRAMRENPELQEEVAALLAPATTGSITITASGERSIAAYTIGSAITGDGDHFSR
ncbi:hypothetical protein ABZW10_28040 [Kitasatospora sp. NPDC004723]|uniref:hypothetical protein n=1 Tax=Kitasatospora sp. NPDC004723 TaxID=3154288 RepID=UPI0033BA1D07